VIFAYIGLGNIVIGRYFFGRDVNERSVSGAVHMITI